MGALKHTPGPWSVISSVRIEAPGFGLVASIRGDLVEGRTHGNARLISAAPDYAAAAAPLVAEIALYEPSAGEDNEERVEVRLGDLRALALAHAKAEAR